MAEEKTEEGKLGEERCFLKKMENGMGGERQNSYF